MSTAQNIHGLPHPPEATDTAAGADEDAPLGIPDLTVKTLGTPKVASPMAPLLENRQTTGHYIDESDRVLLDDTSVASRPAAFPSRSCRAWSRAAPGGRSSSTRRRPARRSSPAAGCVRVSTT
jgi:hypothetical protein